MSDDPVAILKSRLAKGEISIEEYKALLAEISVTAAPQPDQNGLELEKIDNALLAHGYMINRYEKKVYKREESNGAGAFSVIGTLDGWFLWGRAIGFLLLFLFAGGIVVSGVMWMFADPGTPIDVFMDDNPIFPILVLLIQFGGWGLFLRYQRARYMEFEDTYAAVLKDLSSRSSG